jgi:branched-chain amino acid transport system permease protein
VTRQPIPVRTRWLAGAGIASGLAVLGALLPPEPLTIATTVLFFVTLAQSWNVIGGFTGYPSLGQVTFSGVGGYCAAVLTARAGLWFWVALPVSAVFTATVAAILGAPLLRLRRNAFAVATLGLAAGTQQLAASLPVTGGGAGLTIPTNGPGPHTAYPGPLVFYWAFLALAAAAIAVVAWLASGRFGLALQAIRADETAASSAGVATTRIKVAALSLSASLAGTAGALLAFQQVVVFPDSLFDISTTTLIVVMAVVGGRGTVLGPVVGAVVFGTLKAALPLVADKLYPLLLPMLIIAAVTLLPDGVVGIARGKPWARFPALDAIRRYRL